MTYTVDVDMVPTHTLIVMLRGIDEKLMDASADVTERLTDSGRVIAGELWRRGVLPGYVGTVKESGGQR